MNGNATGWWARTTQDVAARVVLYYLALLGAGWLLARVFVLSPLPSSTLAGLASLGAVGREGAGLAPAAAAGPSATTAAVAMVSAILLAIPIAWVYILTRAKRGYQQSVVQTLVVLPTIVAGVVVLVKDSLPLAFGLAGIVAAVRFRTAIDDSKDAVYIFFATALGLAAAVNVPVAFTISIVFNLLIFGLWRSEFGKTPAHLDGRAGERKLRKAMEELSRTGTFVARIDNEVFQDMSAEQLQAVADRAWRRARRNNPEAPDGEGKREALLRVRTYDPPACREAIEPLFDERLKKWRYGGVAHEAGGIEVLEYAVCLRKSVPPDALASALVADGAPHVLDVELN